MKIKLFVLAGLALAVIAIVIVSLRSDKPTQIGTCETFIAAIQEGDVDTTYDMFTERGRSFITKEKWTVQVSLLKAAYGTAEAKPLGDVSVITDAETGATTKEQRPYAIQNGENKYKATCFITTAEPEKIDSFGSQVGF